MLPLRLSHKIKNEEWAGRRRKEGILKKANSSGWNGILSRNDLLRSLREASLNKP